MEQWRTDVAERLSEIKRLLELSPCLPRHVLDGIAKKVAQIDYRNVEPDYIRALVRGAFRAISESGEINETEPLIKVLSTLEVGLPAEV